jgi:hypothetical protein
VIMLTRSNFNSLPALCGTLQSDMVYADVGPTDCREPRPLGETRVSWPPKAFSACTTAAYSKTSRPPKALSRTSRSRITWQRSTTCGVPIMATHHQVRSCLHRHNLQATYWVRGFFDTPLPIFCQWPTHLSPMHSTLFKTLRLRTHWCCLSCVCCPFVLVGRYGSHSLCSRVGMCTRCPISICLAGRRDVGVDSVHTLFLVACAFHTGLCP